MKRSNVHCTMYIEFEVYIEYKVGTQGGQRTGRREISGVELTGCCHVGTTKAPRSATVVIHICSRDSVFHWLWITLYSTLTMRASENACVIYGGDKRRGKRDGHCVGDGRCKTNFCRILSPITQSLSSSSLNNTRPSTQPMKVMMCNTFESLTRDGPKQPELGNKEGTKLCLQLLQAGPIFVYISI